MSLAYFFPPDNSRARAVSIAPWSTGLVIPRWSGPPVVWQWSAGVLTSAAVPLASSCGFSAAAPDGSGNVWMTQYGGALVQYTSGAVASAYNLPSNLTFNGCVYLPQFGQPYAAAMDGEIYAGSGVVPVAGTSPSSGVTWGLAASGSTLFSLASGGLNTLTLSSATSGTSGFVAYPFETGLCLTASSAASAVVVGGWARSAMASAYTDFIFAPASPLMVAIGAGNNLDLYLGTNEVWSLTQTITGVGNPVSGAFTPNGTQVLITDTVSGTVKVYRYSLGTLNLQQSIPVSGALDVTVTLDGTKAIVSQPSQNSITPLNLTGTGWVSGAVIGLGPTPGPVLATGTNSVVVGFASGASFLGYSATGWAAAAILTFSYAPVSIAMGSGAVFFTGTSGPSGYFTAVSGTTPLFTYSWPGSGTSVIYEQGQIAVSDPSLPLFWIFGNTMSSYRYMSLAVPEVPISQLRGSPGTIYSPGGTVFAAGSGQTLLYQWTTPFTLEVLRTGKVGILTSGGWTVTSLGSGNTPTAVAFDASGRVRVATLENDLYTLNLSGMITASGVIAAYQGQLPSTPLGISAMTVLGSGLYAASSMPGFVAELD